MSFHQQSLTQSIRPQEWEELIERRMGRRKWLDSFYFHLVKFAFSLHSTKLNCPTIRTIRIKWIIVKYKWIGLPPWSISLDLRKDIWCSGGRVEGGLNPCDNLLLLQTSTDKKFRFPSLFFLMIFVVTLSYDSQNHDFFFLIKNNKIVNRSEN